MPRENDGPQPYVERVYMLSTKERLLTAVIGIAMGSVGVVAVFWSKNDISSATLVVIGGILLLVAISGLPPRRLTTPVGEVELMQRVQRIEGTFVRVAEEAPELARPFLEAIASDKRFDDRLSRAAKSTLDMMAGSNVMDAVKRLTPSLATIEGGKVQLPGKQLLLNGLIKLEGRSVGIDVRRRPGGWESFCQTVAEAMDLERLDYVVVVLTGAASKEKKEMLKAAAYDGSRIAICTWNSAKDDEELKRALLQALRPGQTLQR